MHKNDLYQNANQYRSRLDQSISDVLCQYRLPFSLDNSAFHFLQNSDFSNWIQTIIMTNLLSLSRLCYFAGYLFAFYHYLYYSKYEQLNLTNSRLSIIQQTIMNLSLSDQNQDLKQLSIKKYIEFFSSPPIFNIKRISDEYYMYVNVDGIIWETLMNQLINNANIDNVMKSLLDSFFQTEYLDVTILGKSQPIQYSSIYYILYCQALSFSYSPSVEISTKFISPYISNPFPFQMLSMDNKE